MIQLTEEEIKLVDGFYEENRGFTDSDISEFAGQHHLPYNAVFRRLFLLVYPESRCNGCGHLKYAFDIYPCNFCRHNLRFKDYFTPEEEPSC